MRLYLLTLLLSLPPAGLSAQPSPVSFPDANTIMARVAANQDTSEAERAHFVYIQHARVTSRKGSIIRCEEITDTRITPTTKGSDQHLLKLEGRLLSKDKKYITYNTLLPGKDTGDSSVEIGHQDLSITLGDDSTDRDLVEHMRNNFTNDNSKDGLSAGLFPLTSKTQADYQFHFIGRENQSGHNVFHIAFQPKEKNDFSWKGDAYIDTTAYQPVLVRTTMSRKIPFAVRTLLGTSLPGLGFTVIYAPQSGTVWFPVSFGTEFKIHILFFFRREIILSAENRNFEQTHVQSKIVPTNPPG